MHSIVAPVRGKTAAVCYSSNLALSATAAKPRCLVFPSPFHVLVVPLSFPAPCFRCPAAKEVAQCLARVIASSKLVQKALAKGAASGGGGGGITDVLKLFMRGLKTVAVAAVPGHSSPLAASVKDACRELGSDISSEVVGRAAVFLLKSLESLGGGDEVG